MNFLVDESLLDLGRALIYSGYNANKHDIKIKSTFDIFDTVKPNFYICDIDYLTTAKIKCIIERPELRVVVFGDNENNLKALKNTVGDCFELFDHNGWADLTLYKKTNPVKELYTDLVMIEDLAELVGNPFVPINESDYIFRIFCPQHVRHPNYCGFLEDYIKHVVYASANKCLWSYKSIFNVIASGGTPLDGPEDLTYESVIQSKTSFDVLQHIFDRFKMQNDSDNIKKKKEKILSGVLND